MWGRHGILCPPSKKVGGHVPRVPHQIAPMRVKCFTCRLMWAKRTKCAHFLIGKGIFDWKHALEHLSSHEHSVERIDFTIAFSRRSLCRIDTKLASQVNQCEQYWKSPLPAAFGFCRKIYCWGRTGVYIWWKRWIAQKVFPKNFQNFFLTNIKKKRCDASSNYFCNSFTNR